MSSTVKRQLAIFWLHWVLVNATSVSTFVGFVGSVGFIAHQVFRDHAPLCALCAVFAGIGGVGYAQELVLRGTELQNKFWVMVFYVGLFVGFWCACGGLIPTAYFATGSRFSILMATFFDFFLFGAGLGGLQTAGYYRSRLQHIAWTTASGLGFGVAAITTILFMGRGHEPTVGEGLLAATIVGGVYGMVTGGCLVWLLHTAIPPPPIIRRPDLKSPGFEFLKEAQDS